MGWLGWWIPMGVWVGCGGAGRVAKTSSPTGSDTEIAASDTEATDTDSAGGGAPTDTSTSSLVATGMTGVWALTGCTGTPTQEPGARADVEAVSMSGGPTEWTVSVTVRSPDVDCDQYADWWEIVTPDGALVYRRILNHSHPTEQPFTRSSEGTVALTDGTTYRVRAHLHPDGYGGQVMEGTPAGGFSAVDVEEGWAMELATQPPLPEDCWF